MRKPAFCIWVTAKLISAFVFTTWIVLTFYYQNPKFQASSHLLYLYSLVCVGPSQKPRRPVFSQRGSYNTYFLLEKCEKLLQKASKIFITKNNKFGFVFGIYVTS